MIGVDLTKFQTTSGITYTKKQDGFDENVFNTSFKIVAYFEFNIFSVWNDANCLATIMVQLYQGCWAT